MYLQHFSPFEELARQLLSGLAPTTDGSHDVSHLCRVWQNAKQIAASEGGDLRLLAAAVLLHDAVVLPKNSPERARASRLAADHAVKTLFALGWSGAELDTVEDAVLCHSFAAVLTPRKLEGRILQDADRLDAIGMVGIARCFYTAGRLGSALYDEADPAATLRTPDDTAFALDHFPAKLLNLHGSFLTSTGAALAAERHRELERFYRNLLHEVNPDPRNGI